MKVTEGIGFLKTYSNFRPSNIDQLELEGVSQYIGNISYYVIDEESLEEVQHELKVHLELEEPSSEFDNNEEESTY